MHGNFGKDPSEGYLADGCSDDVHGLELNELISVKIEILRQPRHIRIICFYIIMVVSRKLQDEEMKKEEGWNVLILVWSIYFNQYTTTAYGTISASSLRINRRSSGVSSGAYQ
jgi:hypothetical protein